MELLEALPERAGRGQLKEAAEAEMEEVTSPLVPKNRPGKGEHREAVPGRGRTRGYYCE